MPAPRSRFIHANNSRSVILDLARGQANFEKVHTVYFFPHISENTIRCIRVFMFEIVSFGPTRYAKFRRRRQSGEMLVGCSLHVCLRPSSTLYQRHNKAQVLIVLQLFAQPKRDLFTSPSRLQSIMLRFYFEPKRGLVTNRNIKFTSSRR